jgi:hypothetical protein
MGEPTSCCRSDGGYCQRCDLLVGLDEVDLVDGPEITEVLGQTGGLIEALCLPSHLDLRPVGFDEVWHRR